MGMLSLLLLLIVVVIVVLSLDLRGVVACLLMLEGWNVVSFTIAMMVIVMMVILR
jgi:hypothetical protein